MYGRSIGIAYSDHPETRPVDLQSVPASSVWDSETSWWNACLRTRKRELNVRPIETSEKYSQVLCCIAVAVIVSVDNSLPPRCCHETVGVWIRSRWPRNCMGHLHFRCNRSKTDPGSDKRLKHAFNYDMFWMKLVKNNKKTFYLTNDSQLYLKDKLIIW